MHTPKQSPDWMRKPANKINIWQRLAISFHGTLTPGNIVSLVGLVIVIYGAIRLYQGRWQEALLLIVLGRAADLADGYLAQWTGTKSRLGEIVDTTCDKMGILALAISLLVSGMVPLYVILPLLLYHLCLMIFAAIWGRRYRLNTTRFGKLAMAASLFVILAAIIYANVPNRITLVLYAVCAAAFLGLALASIYAYSQAIRKAAARSNEHAAWTREVTEVIHIFNPHASNYQRAEKSLTELCKRCDWKPRRFDVTKRHKDIESYIRASYKGRTLLITIAGGDGTVSGVVNTLIELSTSGKVPKLLVLPLWGGNANDFSYMLNGSYGSRRIRRLVTEARPASLPCIRLDASEKKRKRTMYACCYASFGASAFAARRLESRRFSTSSVMRWFPPLLVVRELAFVAKALVESPLKVAEINSRETSFYEHTIINGSRIAKVNRIPVQIDEPVFFHALVEDKHPSVVINLLRILLGRPDTVYGKKSSLSFTTRQPLDAQIDGEVVHFDADVDISARIVYPKAVSFISSNLTD